jgi:hypothetical protein
MKICGVLATSTPFLDDSYIIFGILLVWFVQEKKNLFKKVFLKKNWKFQIAFFIFLEDFPKNTFFSGTNQPTKTQIFFSVFPQKFPRKN